MKKKERSPEEQAFLRHLLIDESLLAKRPAVEPQLPSPKRIARGSDVYLEQAPNQPMSFEEVKLLSVIYCVEDVTEEIGWGFSDKDETIFFPEKADEENIFTTDEISKIIMMLEARFENHNYFISKSLTTNSAQCIVTKEGVKAIFEAVKKKVLETLEKFSLQWEITSNEFFKSQTPISTEQLQSLTNEFGEDSFVIREKYCHVTERGLMVISQEAYRPKSSDEEETARSDEEGLDPNTDTGNDAQTSSTNYSVGFWSKEEREDCQKELHALREYYKTALEKFRNLPENVQEEDKAALQKDLKDFERELDLAQQAGTLASQLSSSAQPEP